LYAASGIGVDQWAGIKVVAFTGTIDADTLTYLLKTTRHPVRQNGGISPVSIQPCFLIRQSHFFMHAISPQRFKAPVPLMVLAILIISTGCSKEELKEKFDQAKQKTQEFTDSTVAAIEEKLPETGNVRLSMSPEVPEAKSASIELITVGDGRPSVVQILTYDPDSRVKSYPAILISGPTEATSLAMLSGQQIECDLYLQASSGAPILMTRPGESVTVTFATVDAVNQTVTASINSVQLDSSDGQATRINDGELIAVIRQENP
jgi:hypothetical protein